MKQRCEDLPLHIELSGIRLAPVVQLTLIMP